MKMSVRGLVVNMQTRKARYVRLRMSAVKEGTILSRLRGWFLSAGKSYLAQEGQSIILERRLRFPREIFFLHDGEATPLIIDGTIHHPTYSDGVFDGALKSKIADRVVHGGMNFYLIALIILGLVAFVAVVT